MTKSISHSVDFYVDPLFSYINQRIILIYKIYDMNCNNTDWLQKIWNLKLEQERR